MAAPTFVQAGTGAIYQSGAAVACSLAGAVAGNVVILHVLIDAVDGAVISSVTNMEDLAGTDNAMTTLVTETTVGGGTPPARQSLYIGRALTSAPAVSVRSLTSGPDCYFRLYEFSTVNTGTTLSAVLENSTAGNTENGAATSGTIDDTGVTTIGADRLALNFIAVNDDNQAFFDTEAFTGQTGGTWVSCGSFGSSTGTDGSIGLQRAEMASAGTIDGGTLTMDSDAWGVVGFALIGTTVDVTLLPSPTNFGAHAIFQPTM